MIRPTDLDHDLINEGMSKFASVAQRASIIENLYLKLDATMHYNFVSHTAEKAKTTCVYKRVYIRARSQNTYETYTTFNYLKLKDRSIMLLKVLITRTRFVYIVKHAQTHNNRILENKTLTGKRKNMSL